MRVAVDTSVFISTLIKPESHIGIIVVRMRDGDFTLLYSLQMLEEFAEVVTRDKIWKKYKLTDEIFNSFINSLTAHGKRVEVVTIVDICRDPDDNLFLSIALDGGADYIVSGDKDLLDLVSFQNMPIIKPSEFLKMFE